MSELKPLEAALSFEVAQMSRAHLLGVMFPRSKATSYPAVVAICKGAAQYWETDIEGLLYHFAVFSRESEQIARALAVANYANTITAARFFARGLPLVDTQRLYESLKCFVQSQSCNDVRAHCVMVVSDRPGYDYFVPCRLIASRWPKWKIEAAHPSTPQDQLQAMAVEAGCDWCPNFDPAQLRRTDATDRLSHNPSEKLEWPQDTMK